MARRPLRPVVPLTLLGLTLSSVFLILHSTRFSRADTAQNDSGSCCGPGPTVAPRELDFPYYSLRDGFSSVLNLVSDSPDPINLSIAIHGRTGQTVLTQVSIQPQQKLALDLRQTLVGLGADTNGAFAEGSISVYFEGTIMPVVGQVTMTNAALKLVHESEMVENDPGRSDIPPVLNALWWNLGGGRDATIMVSNMSGSAATADVYLDFGGKRHTAAPLVFSAHETKIVSVLNLLGGLGSSASEAPEGGITIIARGTTPVLIAQGRVLDPVTGFSTTLEFPDPARQNASALHASGLPIGTPAVGSPYAGTGTFTPHVVVRNLLPNPQTVTVSLEYPTGKYQVQGPGPEAEKRGKKEFDGEGGEGTQTLPVGPFMVAAFGTQDISLDAAIGQLPLPIPFGSIRIQYSGAPGTLVAQVSSVDARQDLVVDARVANEGDGWASSGANPWHLDDQTESILFLTNESGELARIGFSMTVLNVHYYLTSLSLAPHETRVIDIRKLRDAQLPDFRGSRIPNTASDGNINWIRMDNLAVSGRVLVISRSGGISSSYDCCDCPCPDGYTGLSVDPANLQMTVGNVAQCYATAEFVDCNGSYTYDDVTTASFWSSNNSAVATVSIGMVSAAGPGSATVTASYTDWYTDASCQRFRVTYRDTILVSVTPTVSGISPAQGLIGVVTSVTISGNGFGTSPTVNAGTGITATVNSSSGTSISASFNVASSAPAGNHSVTVTAGGQTSGSVNFYVQVPTFFVVTLNATATGSCTINGVQGTVYHRKLTYQVRDQSPAPHLAIAVSGMSVGEHICNQLDGCNLGHPTEGFWFTDATGTISPPDDNFLCSAVPLCPGCTESWNQDFTVSNNNGGTWYPNIINGSASGPGNSVSMACGQYPAITPGLMSCH